LLGRQRERGPDGSPLIVESCEAVIVVAPHPALANAPRESHGHGDGGCRPAFEGQDDDPQSLGASGDFLFAIQSLEFRQRQMRLDMHDDLPAGMAVA